MSDPDDQQDDRGDQQRGQQNDGQTGVCYLTDQGDQATGNRVKNQHFHRVCLFRVMTQKPACLFDDTPRPGKL
jgi:hypothetical protein